MWTFFQEVSTHVYLKDTAKTLQQLIEMKKIKNPLLVVGLDAGQNKILTVLFVSKPPNHTLLNLTHQINLDH